MIRQIHVWGGGGGGSVPLVIGEIQAGTSIYNVTMLWVKVQQTRVLLRFI